MKYDYAIVGAGIVGLSIGYKIIESENKNAKILIIDKVNLLQTQVSK